MCLLAAHGLRHREALEINQEYFKDQGIKDILNHSAYSLDLTPSDFYRFISLKTRMSEKRIFTQQGGGTIYPGLWKKEMAEELFEESVKKHVS